MNPIQYFISIVSDFVNYLKGISLAPFGLPNINLFQIYVALYVGCTALTLIGKEDDEDD